MAEETDKEKSDQAAKIVRNHMLGSVAAGLIPIPLVDIGILGGIHLRMLSKLAKLYEVEFSEQRANSIIGSLAGIGVAATAASLLRSLPGIGRALFGLGALTLPPASTYALGHVFIKHFESGGTFLTFDAARAKEDYNEKLAEGKKVVEQNFAGVRP
jgi:uncharacterized protein (DUF697 family)